jgi:hypothetical protein
MNIMCISSTVYRGTTLFFLQAALKPINDPVRLNNNLMSITIASNGCQALIQAMTNNHVPRSTNILFEVRSKWQSSKVVERIS